MTPTQETFAILEEQAGCRHWVRAAGQGFNPGFTPAIAGPPKHLQYADREFRRV